MEQWSALLQVARGTTVASNVINEVIMTCRVNKIGGCRSSVTKEAAT